MSKASKRRAHSKSIDLPMEVRVAFQGGGALGAYGAGVGQALDQDPHIRVTQAGGLSAGAANSALLATSGSQGLQSFWHEIGRAGEAAKILDPFGVMNAFNNSYLMNSWRRSGAAYQTGLSPQNHLETLLRDHIGSDRDLQKGMTEIFVSTVTQRNPHGGFSPDNLNEHIHSGEDLTIRKIVASGALKALGPIKIGHEHHWDGVYGQKNPNLDVYDTEDPRPLLVITVDRPEVRFSSIDRDIAYGLVHRDIEDLKTKMTAPIYQVSLEQPRHWGDHVRMNPNPRLIDSLQEAGFQDGSRVIGQMKAEKYGHGWQERIAPAAEAA